MQWQRKTNAQCAPTVVHPSPLSHVYLAPAACAFRCSVPCLHTPCLLANPLGPIYLRLHTGRVVVNCLSMAPLIALIQASASAEHAIML